MLLILPVSGLYIGRMTRLVALGMGIVAAVVLFSRIHTTHAQPAVKWQTGYWVWNQVGTRDASGKVPVDEIYVYAGELNRQTPWNANLPWTVWTHLPDRVPDAASYWMVFRAERQMIPDVASAVELGKQIAVVREVARQRHWNVIGVQLDVDSPTGRLAEYAEYLRALRRALPKDTQFSITALLDWFRAGTAIDRVIEQVDEFVPQFYDIGPGGLREKVIAAKIDPGAWSPKFSRFGKRYKIGVSSFGRAREISQGKAVEYIDFSDLTPRAIASNPAFSLEQSRNSVGELVLTYRAARDITIDYARIQKGDALQFTMATPEVIRAGVASAKAMKGCAGVIFFRWPAEGGESLVMRPDEVLIAAGAMSEAVTKLAIETIDAHCAAVSCVDLYLSGGKAATQEMARYRIRSSSELDYFLPDRGMAIRMTGPTMLDLTIEPFSGATKVFLGRAVMKKAGEFRVEEVR